jgi:hypothetical protein
MRGKWLVVVVVASLALNLAVVGAYFYRQRHRSPGEHRPSVAGLNREARQRVKEVFGKSLPEMQRIGQERKRIHAALLDEALKPELNQARVDSLADELGRLHAQAARILCQDAHAVAATLPAGSRERFFQNQGLFGPRHGRGMKRHGHGFRDSGPMPPEEEPPMPPPEDIPRTGR